jgi:hypothetical protein
MGQMQTASTETTMAGLVMAAGLVTAAQLVAALRMAVRLPMMAVRLPMMAVRLPMMAVRLPTMAVRLPTMAVRLPTMAVRLPMMAAAMAAAMMMAAAARAAQAPAVHPMTTANSLTVQTVLRAVLVSQRSPSASRRVIPMTTAPKMTWGVGSPVRMGSVSPEVVAWMSPHLMKRKGK